MLTQEGCVTRITNLWNRLPETIDWVLVADPRHVQYFCNFRPNPISFSADQNSLLLLERNGRSRLLVANFTRRTAIESPFVDEEIVVPWYTHRKSVANRDLALVDALQQCQSVWSSGSGLLETEAVSDQVASCLRQQCVSAVMDSMTGHETTLGTMIRSLRRRKLPDELELLRLCMAAGDAGQAVAFDVVKEGNSEFDVYLAVQRAAQQAAGGPCVVYGDFRATNAENFKAGGLPTNYLLRSGDLFILDYSVVINGYRSDFTNTIAVGDPTPDQVRQFETCRDALEAAASVLKAGISGKDVYEAASAVFVAEGYPPLAHHCGHGLGMEHPEPPILVPESTDELVAGDVVTIEPGLYVEGVGGMRFEHNYLITDSGSERLSNHRISLQP